MQKLNSIIKKIVNIICVLLLLTYSLTSPAHHIISNTANSVATTSSNCDAPDAVFITSLSTTQITISWSSSSNATAYKVDVTAGSSPTSSNTILAPDTILNFIPSTLLADGDEIIVCVTSICGSSSGERQMNCRTFTYRTALATVEPVYKEDMCNNSDCHTISLQKFDFSTADNCTKEDIDLLKSAYYDYQEFCQYCINNTDENEPIDCGSLKICLEQVKEYVYNRITYCDNPFPKTQIPLQSTNITTIQFYPNPIKKQGFITYELAAKSPVSIQILDQSGQQLFTQTTLQDAGSQSLAIDLTHLPTGIFYYTLQTAQQAHQGKLIKVD